MVNFGVPFLHHAFQELEMRHHARLRALEPARDVQGRRFRLRALELNAVIRIFFLVQLDAVEARQEVDVPPVAAELAVGDRLQARGLPAASPPLGSGGLPLP